MENSAVRKAPLLEAARAFQDSFSSVEFFAGFPGALPVLFRRPRFGFEEMEVTRATGEISEMPHGHERFVDEAAVHLRVVELKPDPVIIWSGM